jgi:hypothetical protein
VDDKSIDFMGGLFIGVSEVVFLYELLTLKREVSYHPHRFCDEDLAVTKDGR